MRIVRQIVLMLLVGLVATPPTTWADASVDAGKKSRMQTCNVGRLGSLYSISNAATVDSCTSAGSVGLFTALCQCQNDGIGGYEWTSVSAGGVDLSAYVLLAGDADGQTIQGRTGENQARIDIGGSSSSQVTMHGTGLLHGVASVDNEGAYLYSADSGSYVYAIDSEGTVIGSTVAIRLIYGQTPPTNANDPCTAGDTIDTATFHYYCAATDTWVRVAMATWP